MIVDISSILFNPDQIKLIEEKYNAKYVCETCIKGKNNNWVNQPFVVFYTEEPHPQGSNYFGLFFQWMGGPPDNLALSVCNAITATEPFQGVTYDGETVYYSRYRHDFRQVSSGFVDGGRDYLRYDPTNARIVKLQIVKDKLEVIHEEVPALDAVSCQ